MITLKEWNSLPQHKRDKAADRIFYNMPDWYIKNMAEEWHHRLDAEHNLILQSLYKKKMKEGNTVKDYYIVRVEEVL